MGKGHVSRAQAVVVSILQCYACFESLSCFPNEYVIARLLGAGSTRSVMWTYVWLFPRMEESARCMFFKRYLRINRIEIF